MLKRELRIYPENFCSFSMGLLLTTQYENAIRSGNTEALKALVTDDLATALSGPEAKEAMEFLKLMIPSDTEFLNIAAKEKTAVLKISGKQDGEKVNGTVDMVLDDGQWKVQKLSIVNTE